MGGFLVYKDHTIIASAARDETTGEYEAIASITWVDADGKRGIHVLTNAPERCASRDQASAAALEIARAWVARRLRHCE